MCFWWIFNPNLQHCHGSRVEREPPGTTKKYCVFDEGRTDICIYIQMLLYIRVQIWPGRDPIISVENKRFLPLIEDTSHSTFLVPHWYGPPHSGAWREDSSHSYK